MLLKHAEGWSINFDGFIDCELWCKRLTPVQSSWFCQKQKNKKKQQKTFVFHSKLAHSLPWIVHGKKKKSIRLVTCQRNLQLNHIEKTEIQIEREITFEEGTSLQLNDEWRFQR